MGFCSLQHMKGSKVYLTRVRPPTTFRLQGLVTLLAIYSLRSRAGFFSHRRRSWDSPFGVFSFRKVSELLPFGFAHLPFNLAVFPLPKHRAGPIGPGFWAFTLPEVPGERWIFRSPIAGYSLGFYPFRALLRKPWSEFRPISSHALL